MNTENITNDMLRFREASRHIWNSCFAEMNDKWSLEIHDSFNIIELELLKTMVFHPRKVDALPTSYRKHGLSYIKVVPKSFLHEIPIQFCEVSENGNVVWKKDQLVAIKDLPKLYFLDFFDWDPYNILSMAYIRAETVEDKQVVLIAETYCDFFWNSQPA